MYLFPLIYGEVSLRRLLVSEILLVLARFKQPEDELNKLQKIFKNHATIIFPKRTIDICRDPKDNYVLDLCLAGKADYLITGDQDLLILTQSGKTKIVTLQEFLNIVKYK